MPDSILAGEKLSSSEKNNKTLQGMIWMILQAFHFQTGLIQKLNPNSKILGFGIIPFKCTDPEENFGQGKRKEAPPLAMALASASLLQNAIK